MKKYKLITILVLFCFAIALGSLKNDIIENKETFNMPAYVTSKASAVNLIKYTEVEAEDRTEELKELQKVLNISNNKLYLESTKLYENSELYAVSAIEYRAGAGEDYEVLGTLEEKTKVQTTGITQNDWYQCNIDGQVVYIKINDLEEKKVEIIATGTKAEYQKYAYSLFADYGWSDDEFDPLVRLWNRESGWSPSAHNSSSGAHGIPQSLPASKMASEGDDYYTNGYTQIRWGLKYIKNRYGMPSAAWAHSESTGWY